MIEASAIMVEPPALFRRSFANTWIPRENSATAPTRIELGAGRSATIAHTAAYTFRQKLKLSDSQIKRLRPGDFRKFDVLSQITSSWLTP